MRNLVIVGRDFEQIIALCAAVTGCFDVTTVVETAELNEAVQAHASNGHNQMLVCVDDSDVEDAARGLHESCTRIVFLVPASAAYARSFLTQEGAIVLRTDEPTETLLATLHAYART